MFQGIQAVALQLSTEFGYTREIEDRVQAPCPIWLVAVAKVMSGSVQGVLAAVVVFPMAAVIHAPGVEAHLSIHWWVIITLIPLACVAMTALGLVLGTTFEPRNIGLMFGFVVLPLTFLGGTYYQWTKLSPVQVGRHPLVADPGLGQPADLRRRGHARRLDRGLTHAPVCRLPGSGRLLRRLFVARLAQLPPPGALLRKALPIEGASPFDLRSALRRMGGVLLLAALIFGLLLAIPPLRNVLRAISRMSPGWIAVAIALELASCASFVVVFRLFFSPLAPPQARRLAWAEMASGVLLPAGGVGGLAIGGWLMHLAGMSTRSIIKRLSALFFVTSAASVAAMIAAAALLLAGLAAGPEDFIRATLPILAGALATVFVLALPARQSRRAARPGGPAWISDLIEGIREAEYAVRKPSWRLLGAIGYLLFDIAVLWAAFAALGAHPPLAPLTLGYIIGYLANFIPIPGGVGVLDGGLVATLIIYGISPIDAGAAVLVYHAIAFWVPGLGGLLGLAMLRQGLSDEVEPI